MTYEAALAEARILKTFLEAHHVDCSIELVPGARAKEGWLNPVGRFRLEMSHHIVSRRSQGLTPFLDLVKRGREDKLNPKNSVKGPLANGYGGFDQIYRPITMGVANHSGRGGPLTLDGITIAADQAAYFAWGTEYEGGLDPDDWPRSYRLFMAASNAAVLDYLAHRNPAVTDEAHCEHSTWAPGRKSDRMFYTRAVGIAEIKAHRAAMEGEDDVALTQRQQDALDWLARNAEALDVMRSQVEQLYDRRDEIDAAAGGVAIMLARDPADVDEAHVASAIADALNDSLARRVVDELNRRLAS